MTIDMLQAWYGGGFRVNDFIYIHQPTISEIIEFGEEQYFNTVYTLCAIPSDVKSVLDDIGKDYEQTSDFECFALLAKSLTQQQTSILLGDLDFQKFTLCTRKDNGDLVLFNHQDNILIDKYVYYIMINYLRTINYIVPKVEKAGNALTKQVLIDEDREARQSKKKFQSLLFPLLSTMLCYSGFKYKKSELNEVGIMEFLDAVQRSQIIESVSALMRGMYSGMIDTKKIKNSELNWFREIAPSSHRENIKIPT